LGEKGGRDAVVLLGGTALRVYLYLLRAGRPVGVRELQRALGFRSPSTAKHHLDRLASLGLVEKRGDGYVARRGGRGEVLSIFISFAGSLLPRMIPAAVFATAGLVSYVVLRWPSPDPVPIAILGCVAGYLWFEGLGMLSWIRRVLLGSCGKKR